MPHQMGFESPVLEHPDLAQEPPEVSRKILPKRLLTCLGACAIALSFPVLAESYSTPYSNETRRAANALTNVDSSEQQTALLQGVGFSTNKVWVENSGEAHAEAQRVTDVGSNTIRIANPYTRGGISVHNDLKRLCNTANVAAQNDLDLIISWEGRYQNKELGYIPTTASEKRKYLTAIINMMDQLYGDQGCAQSPPSLNISLFNEPNNPLFLRNQYINGEWVAPKQVISLYEYSYGRLHQKAESLGLNFRIIAGELRQRDAGKFLRRMAEIVKEQKIKNKIADVMSYHYYANGPDAQSSQAAVEYIQRLNLTIDEGFGYMEKWITEVGAITTVPASLKKHYTKKKASTRKPLTPREQGVFYRDFYRIAACNGIKRVINFHYSDDGGILTTGVAYKPKRNKPAIKKASYPIVQQSFNEALTGKIEC